MGGRGGQPVPPVCMTHVWCHPRGRAARGVKYELRVPGRSWRSASCSLALFPPQGRRSRSARAGADPSAGCGQPRCPEHGQLDLGRPGRPHGLRAQPWPCSASGWLCGIHHPCRVHALSLAPGCGQQPRRVVFPRIPYVSVVSEVLEGLNVPLPSIQPGPVPRAQADARCVRPR